MENYLSSAHARYGAMTSSDENQVCLPIVDVDGIRIQGNAYYQDQVKGFSLIREC